LLVQGESGSFQRRKPTRKPKLIPVGRVDFPAQRALQTTGHLLFRFVDVWSFRWSSRGCHHRVHERGSQHSGMAVVS
jgi:hypothetical protein